LPLPLAFSSQLCFSAKGQTAACWAKFPIERSDSSGVTVTVVNEATGVSRDMTTSDSGDYDFVEVPVGTYRLEFDLKGFKKNVRRGVGLDINQVITLNMTMQVGASKKLWT